MAKVTLIHSYHLVTISFGVLVMMLLCIISTIEFLIILDTINLYTPLFQKKMLIFVLQFICTCKNEIITLLFVQQNHKHMAWAWHEVRWPFLTSRSGSKHILFALGLILTARDAMKAGVLSDLVSQATPFALPCETSISPCSLATQV